MKCLRPRLRKRERHTRSSRVRGKQFVLEAFVVLTFACPSSYYLPEPYLAPVGRGIELTPACLAFAISMTRYCGLCCWRPGSTS
jgi:hypothetical protein